MRVRRAVGVAVAVALLAGCSGGGGDREAASPSPAAPAGTTPPAATTPPVATVPRPTGPFTGGDFYAPPEPLPSGEHGTLLRYQPTAGSARSDSYRIMYLSEAVDGSPIVVTGRVLVPKAPAPAGGRRVITVAHGTTGVADECAPSKSDRPGGEVSLLEPALEAGYLVVATDYEGLGTPGVHPYLVGVSEGRGVIDAVRAARDVPGASPGAEIAIAGYSQGGHGALWAGQVAATWAPELRVVGTVAGAPATELPLIAGAAASAGAVAGFFLLVAAGFADAYPYLSLDQVLTPQGVVKATAAGERGCVGQVIADAVRQRPADLVKPDAGKVEPWAALYADNDPGRVSTERPVLILHSKQDDVVPAALSAILLQRMCGLGQTVERRVYDRGQGHGAAAPDAYRDGVAWIQDLWGGKAPASSCQSALAG